MVNLSIVKKVKLKINNDVEYRMSPSISFSSQLLFCGSMVLCYIIVWEFLEINFFNVSMAIGKLLPPLVLALVLLILVIILSS